MTEVWKIFYPQRTWGLSSGVLVGVIDYKFTTVTVTAVIEMNNSLSLQAINDMDNQLKQVTRSPDSQMINFQFVGFLINEDDNVDFIKCKEIFILIQKSKNCLFPKCLRLKIMKSNECVHINNVLMIGFDNWFEYHSKLSRITETCPHNGRLINRAIFCLREWNFCYGDADFNFFEEVKSKRSYFLKYFDNSLVLKSWIIGGFLEKLSIWFLRQLFSLKILNNQFMQYVMNWPATGCQLKKKCNQIKECGILEQTQRIKQMNIHLLLLLDCLFGITLVIYLHHIEFSNTLASAFTRFANNTAVSLEQLLHWLMGAPAGLKLNKGLASFLGQFFLYHIYLWVGYLSTIAPFLALSIKFASVFGCLGLSVFIALASDVLSILTFHIYCFYVYAARIYGLQIHGLRAFWQLFRGKKYNVLRRRIDSSDFRVDQLFLGTLLFTILLFLLPTTAFFYLVFTSIRLAVLIPQSFLLRIIESLNRLPMFSLLLWIVHPNFIADGVCFQPATVNQRDHLLLKMQPISFWDLLNTDALDTKGGNNEASWRLLGHNLLNGYLVYPWGGRNDKSHITE